MGYNRREIEITFKNLNEVKLYLVHNGKYATIGDCQEFQSASHFERTDVEKFDSDQKKLLIRKMLIEGFGLNFSETQASIYPKTGKAFITYKNPRGLGKNEKRKLKKKLEELRDNAEKLIESGYISEDSLLITAPKDS